MKRLVWVLTIFILILVVFDSPLFAGVYDEIGTEQVVKLIEKDKKAMLIFPLSQIEFDDEHIAGSVHIRFDELENKLPDDKMTRLIFYSIGKTASIKAAEKAVSLGYTRVYVYRDGLHGWVSADYPTESTNELPYDLVDVVSTDDLFNHLLKDDDIVLLDCSLESDVQKVIIDVSKRIYIPMEELHERYNELPADKKVAVICLSGTRSPTAARFLMSKGFGSVMSVSGGTIKWIAENKPVFYKNK